MRSRGRLAAAVAALEAELLRPRFLRIVAEFVIHDRRIEVDGTRCPCCGSADAEIVERRPAADVVIDTATGRRIHEANVTPAEWTEFCELSALHLVPLRCSRKTLPLLLDETGRHIFAAGGHRSSKTTTGLTWLALQIIRRGGHDRRFWLVAPTDEKCFRLLAKLLAATPSPSGGEVAPILPSVLVARSPATHRASNLQTVLIDGSIIDLRSFGADPSAARAKSDPIVAAIADEAAHLPSAAWMSALRGRCVDLAGRLWLASTATPSSILNELVEKCREWAHLPQADPRRSNGDHEGAAWIFESLPMLDNPWLNRANVESDMRTIDMSRPENRRDYLGEWCASEGLCWTNFTPERHVVVHEARTIGALSPRMLAEHRAGGHVDITPTIARGLFGRVNPHHRMARASNFRFIIGQDVNCNPMSSALLQVSAPADQLEDRDAWHYWIIDTVSTPTSNSLAHAERLVSTELARVLDPDGRGNPLAGCGVVVDATSIGRDPTAHKHGQAGSVVETFWRVGLDARAPAYRKTTNGKPGHHNPDQLARFTLAHRLVNEGRLHVFSRAGELLRAFDTQLATADGIVPLDARRGHWDRVAGPMDATTYAVYAAANMRAPEVARSWSELPVATA